MSSFAVPLDMWLPCTRGTPLLRGALLMYLWLQYTHCTAFGTAMEGCFEWRWMNDCVWALTAARCILARRLSGPTTQKPVYHRFTVDGAWRQMKEALG